MCCKSYLEPFQKVKSFQKQEILKHILGIKFLSIFNQSRLCPLAVPELFPVLKSMRAKGPLVVTRGKDDNFGFITLSYSLNPSPCTNNIIIA